MYSSSDPHNAALELIHDINQITEQKPLLQDPVSGFSSSVVSFPHGQQLVSSEYMPPFSMLSRHSQQGTTLTPSVESLTCNNTPQSLQNLGLLSSTLIPKELSLAQYSFDNKTVVLPGMTNLHSQSSSTKLLDKLLNKMCNQCVTKPIKSNHCRDIINDCTQAQPSKKTDIFNTSTIGNIHQEAQFAIPKHIPNHQLFPKLSPTVSTDIALSYPIAAQNELHTSSNVDTFLPDNNNTTSSSIVSQNVLLTTNVTPKNAIIHPACKHRNSCFTSYAFDSGVITNSASKNLYLTKLLASGSKKLSDTQPEAKDLTIGNTKPNITVLSSGPSSTALSPQTFFLPSVAFTKAVAVSDCQRNLLVGAASQALTGQPSTSKLPQSSICINSSKNSARKLSSTVNLDKDEWKRVNMYHKPGIQCSKNCMKHNALFLSCLKSFMDHRVKYKEHRQVNHINAEQKRRCDIKVLITSDF
ncbi:uncharacterized protein LOC111086943 isoform X2 [Limulus polyphemus]|uniref:Uncharacterized protein LOC111086943 isoform X2 n=1 Tax=Limulus polyphemus TaxID=6850 RepID=A0ABM1SV97_LIMPO|nr:uncharacterized protein LOC111086943 isoform X2 [Limulus polyphemus]